MWNVRATTRDCPDDKSCYVGAILYGCPNYFMHIPYVEKMVGCNEVPTHPTFPPTFYGVLLSEHPLELNRYANL